MLNLSVNQLTQLRNPQQERAATEVARFMREAHFAAALPHDDQQVLDLARRWVQMCLSWHIESTRPMCELSDFRAKWGSFDDAESAWIRAVLEGPLAEADKIDYLGEILYGG